MKSLVQGEDTFDPGGQGQDSKADHFTDVPDKEHEEHEEHEDSEDNLSLSGQGAGHEERQEEAPRMRDLSIRLERDPELDKMSQLLSQRQ